MSRRRAYRYQVGSSPGPAMLIEVRRDDNEVWITSSDREVASIRLTRRAAMLIATELVVASMVADANEVRNLKRMAKKVRQ